MKVRDRLDQIRGILGRCRALEAEPDLVAYFVKLEHEIVECADDAVANERNMCLDMRPHCPKCRAPLTHTVEIGPRRLPEPIDFFCPRCHYRASGMAEEATRTERERCLNICTMVEPFPDGATMRQTIRRRIESGE